MHKNIDISVREIRIASGEVEGVHAVGTCTYTASYSGKSSEKLMKSASVQEAVTAMVNSMQRYTELSKKIQCPSRARTN